MRHEVLNKEFGKGCTPAAPLTIVYGSSHPELAHQVSGRLRLEPLNALHEVFADGGRHIILPDSIRGSDVFVIQPTGKDIYGTTMEAAFIGDALRRSSAKSATLVAPCLGDARQDRQSQGREAVNIDVILRILSGYYNRLVILDPHSDQALNSFQGAIDLLHASPYLVNRVRDWGRENVAVVSPDQGGVPRATAFSRRCYRAGVPVTGHAYCIKAHLPGANRVEIVDFAGDVRGKSAIVFDDMIDTGGTHRGVAIECMKRGAKRVDIVAVHPVMSPTRLEGGQTITALKKIKNSPIDRLLTTNSLPISEECLEDPMVEVADISPLLAATIFRIAHNFSVTSLID